MPGEIALVVVLRLKDALEWRHLCDDGAREGIRLLQLGDVGLGDMLLLVVGKKHG